MGGGRSVTEDPPHLLQLSTSACLEPMGEEGQWVSKERIQLDFPLEECGQRGATLRRAACAEHGLCSLPRTQHLLQSDREQPAGASSGIWQIPKVARGPDRGTEAELMPCPLPPGPTKPEALFPWLVDISQGFGASPRVQGSLSSIPRHHQVSCLQTVPVQLTQGPGPSHAMVL